MTVAYDYDKQEWVKGEAAKLLRIAQIKETLEILWSDKGAEYLVNTHKRGERVVTVTEAIAISEEWLRELATSPCRCGHPKHATQCPNPTGCWCDTFTS